MRAPLGLTALFAIIPLPIAGALATTTTAGCSNKTSLALTICNHAETNVCVTIGNDAPQIVNRGDCVDFSKTTSEKCLTVTVAVQTTDNTSLGPCGATKGTKCMKDGETWTVD